MRTEAEVQTKHDELDAEIADLRPWHLAFIAKVAARTMLRWVLEESGS